MPLPLLPMAAGLAFPFVSAANAIASLFNGKRQIESQTALKEVDHKFARELETRREEFAITKAKLDYTVQFARDQASREWQADQSAIARKHQSREAEIQRFFQAHENELSREAQRQLTEYVQQCENLRQKDRQQHDRLMQADRQRFELETQQRAQAFSVLLMYLQSQEQRKNQDYAFLLQNHPFLLPPTTILDMYTTYRDGDRSLPPMVVVSPPHLSFDRYGGDPNHILGDMSKSLEEEIRVFFEKYNQPEHPVRYISRIWDTNRMKADTAATHLHSLFKTIPTLIIESEAEGDFLNLRRFSWDMGDEHYTPGTVLSQFSMADMLFDIQRDRARQWAHEKVKLAASGFPTEPENSEEEINEHNLNELEREQKYRNQGLNRKVNYKASLEAIMRLKKYLKSLHCLIGGLAVDEYHLTRYGTTPRMPILIGELVNGLPELEANSILDYLVDYYRAIAKQMVARGSSRMPDIAIAVAENLSKLPAAAMHARLLLDLSVTSWLTQRQIAAGSDPLAVMNQALSIGDVAYILKLNAALTNLGDSRQFDVATSCYQRGLRRNQSGEYGAARADFDQVISLNPIVDAYFQRGLSYLRLKDYASAIKDFDATAKRQSERAEIYEYRGDAHQGLQNYDDARLDYNQAIAIGSPAASVKLKKLQDWLDDVKTQRLVAQKADADAKEALRKQLKFDLPNNGGELEFVPIPKSNNLPEFRIGKYPITQRQYQAIMGTNPSHFTSNYNGYDGKQCLAADRPVEQVSWNDAKAFCEALSQKPVFKDAGLKVWLPSEMQWEYACRDGANPDQKTKFWFGDNDDELKHHAWYDKNSNSMTHSVKEREDKNASKNFKLVDMHGNVWEWCADGSNAVRGGSWYFSADYCSSAYRNLWCADIRHNYIGFRVVVSSLS